MEFRLLGPIEAIRDVRVAPAGRREAAGAARSPPAARERGRLARPADRRRSGPAGRPGRAEHSLDVQVSRLRKAFAPDELLLTRSGGYVARGRARRRSTQRRFERLLDEGRRANAAGEPAGRRCSRSSRRSRSGAGRRWRSSPTRTFAHAERGPAGATPPGHDGGIPRRGGSPRTPATPPGSPADLEPFVARAPAARTPAWRLLALALQRCDRQAEALRRLAASPAATSRTSSGIDPGAPPCRSWSWRSCARIRRSSSARPAASSRRRGRARWARARSCWQPPPWRSSWASPRAPPRAHDALAAPDSDVFVDAGSGKLVRAAPVRDTVRRRVRRRRPLEHLVDG